VLQPPSVDTSLDSSFTGSGFRVQGSGFRVQGAGFRVQGSGFRVQGPGSRVQGAGFRVQGAGFRVQGWVQGWAESDMLQPPSVDTSLDSSFTAPSPKGFLLLLSSLELSDTQVYEP